MNKKPLFQIYNKYIYRDFNIVVLDIPILFTCKDKENNYYLVFLIDFIEDSYMIVPISVQNLIKLLSGEITAREPLEVSQTIYCVKYGIGTEKNLSEIDEEELPTKDSYLETSLIENVENYIQELENILKN